MSNTFDSEKKYIELLVNEITQKMQLAQNDSWQQRDFENFNVLIEEKTGIILSVSTLKRIWKLQFSTIPQKNTLNALACFLDYKDWYDFKMRNKIDETTKEKRSAQIKILLQKKKGHFKKIGFYIMPVVLIVFVLFLIFKSQPLQSYTEVHFSSRKNVSSGVPNTVIFDYDISKCDLDSAFIQQSWDRRRRAKLKKDEKYSTSVYYYPGYHLAKLIINDQLVKEIPVYITTDGWLSVIRNPANEIIPVYVRENCISEGRIYISPLVVRNYNIPLDANNHLTSFYYVNEDFNGDSDNFIFETGIKNNIDEGGLTCQFCEISIFAESGRHFIRLCNPGCIGKVMLKFGKEYISGKNNDLSAFGTDLNKWNDVKISVKNRVVDINLNGVSIYKTSFEESNGKIKGVFYNFEGCGSVDYARLYDIDSNLIFAEEF